MVCTCPLPSTWHFKHAEFCPRLAVVYCLMPAMHRTANRTTQRHAPLPASCAKWHSPRHGSCQTAAAAPSLPPAPAALQAQHTSTNICRCLGQHAPLERPTSLTRKAALSKALCWRAHTLYLKASQRPNPPHKPPQLGRHVQAQKQSC